MSYQYRDRDERYNRRSRSRSRSRSRDRARSPSPSYPSSHHNNQQPPPTQSLHIPNALSSILAAQQAAQDKVNRELFVGNTPTGTSEMLLLQFLNGAMRRIGLCQQNESPILNCRVNPKFAFVECKSIQDANLVLNLNGIPFLGTYLKVSRPSKYTGPYVPSKTWQELTNQPPIPNLSSITSTSSSDPTSISAAEEKISRELFIGNTTPEMTESMIREFLGKAMEQVGLSKGPGNPINACRVSGKFAFIELRSREEAENALNLNNIPYLGAMLRVGRPSKYTGPITPHGNWEDILAKYMSGELKLPSQAQTTSNPTLSTTNPTTNTQPTKIVQLRNMLTTTDLESESDYNEILLDTKEECGQFGMLKQVIIPKLNAVGATKIFLEYISEQDAQKAIQALAGRTFDGRRVEAEFFSEVKFYKGDYSD